MAVIVSSKSEFLTIGGYRKKKPPRRIVALLVQGLPLFYFHFSFLAMNNTFINGVPTNGHVGPTRSQRQPHIFPPDLLFSNGHFFPTNRFYFAGTWGMMPLIFPGRRKQNHQYVYVQSVGVIVVFRVEPVSYLYYCFFFFDYFCLSVFYLLLVLFLMVLCFVLVARLHDGTL